MNDSSARSAREADQMNDSSAREADQMNDSSAREADQINQQTTVPVTIESAHDSPDEMRAVAVLQRILDTRDLSRWCYTDHVTVDQSKRTFSHPLTMHPSDTVTDDAALRVFVHEQLHWFVNTRPGTRNAIREAQARWPDPPGFPQGARDAFSTHLHFLVCSLEHRSLTDLIGERASSDILLSAQGYSWIYATVLGDWPWFEDFLERHDLVLPAAAPVPARFEPAGTQVSLGRGRPTLTLETGDPSERQTAEALRGAYDTYPLTRWQWTAGVRVVAGARASAHPTLTLGGRAVWDRDALTALWLRLQIAYFLESKPDGRLGPAVQRLRTEVFAAHPELDDSKLRWTVVCWNALAVLDELFPPDAIDRIVRESIEADVFGLARRYEEEMAVVLEDMGLTVEAND